LSEVVKSGRDARAPLPFLGDQAILFAPEAALHGGADQLIEATTGQPEPSRAHCRVTPKRRLLNCIGVEQELLGIEPNIVELRVELVGRNELPALGYGVDDLLLAAE
jgi:hypothetical protein